MAADNPGSGYNSGVIAGRIAERLDGHDTHFADINGSIKDLIGEVHGLRLDVQQLGLQAIARDATVVTTAAALKDADQARRDSAVQRWSPMAKALAVIGVLAAVAGVVVAIVYGLKG